MLLPFSEILSWPLFDAEEADEAATKWEYLKDLGFDDSSSPLLLSIFRFCTIQHEKNKKQLILKQNAD